MNNIKVISGQESMEKAYADHVSISDKVFTCAQTENNFSLMGGATSDI
jgi:hypothetical protein